MLSQLQNMQLASQLAVKQASTKHILSEIYKGFINTNLDIGCRCEYCDETIDDTVETDVLVLSKHYFDCARMNSNAMQLYNNYGQAYGDSVIDIFIESFSVLNKTTDCVSYPCQAHACAVATRASINTSLYGQFESWFCCKTNSKTNG